MRFLVMFVTAVCVLFLIRLQHFQIQPIKCPVQNNEISTCSLTSDVYATTVSVNCQAQTGSTFMICAYGFRNNYVLHSVYVRSLGDLEKKELCKSATRNYIA